MWMAPRSSFGTVLYPGADRQEHASAAGLEGMAVSQGWYGR